MLWFAVTALCPVLKCSRENTSCKSGPRACPTLQPSFLFWRAKNCQTLHRNCPCTVLLASNQRILFLKESTESDLRWDLSNTASKTGLFSWVSMTLLQLWLRGSKVLHLPSVWNMGTFDVHLGLEGFIKLRFEVRELKSTTLLHSTTVHMGLSLKVSMDWNVLVWILFIFHYNCIVFSILKKVEFLEVFFLHFKSAWQLMLKKWFLKRRQGNLIWE